MHPWIIARSPGAGEVMEAADIAALRRQRMPPDVVREVLADPRPYMEIAKMCRVTYQTIALIKSRRLHGEVSFEGEIPRGTRRGDEKARAIFLDPDDNGTAATKYGVSYTVVTNIRRRRSHETVTRGLTPPLRSRAPRQETLQEMEARHATERAALLRKML